MGVKLLVGEAGHVQCSWLSNASEPFARAPLLQHGFLTSPLSLFSLPGQVHADCSCRPIPLCIYVDNSCRKNEKLSMYMHKNERDYYHLVAEPQKPEGQDVI